MTIDIDIEHSCHRDLGVCHLPPGAACRGRKHGAGRVTQRRDPGGYVLRAVQLQDDSMAARACAVQIGRQPRRALGSSAMEEARQVSCALLVRRGSGSYERADEHERRAAIHTFAA
jgi:hypothetical protein